MADEARAESAAPKGRRDRHADELALVPVARDALEADAAEDDPAVTLSDPELGRIWGAREVLGLEVCRCKVAAADATLGPFTHHRLNRRGVVVEHSEV